MSRRDRRFDIAMDDAFRMRGVERLGNLCANIQSKSCESFLPM